MITFHQSHGRSPDELLTATEATLARLQTAIVTLADLLEIHTSYSNILSVQATLRDVCMRLRTMLP